MKREFSSYLVIVLLAFAITMIILNIFSFYLVSGNSMEPTLKNNNYLIVRKDFLNESNYELGDIIVFSAVINSSLESKKDLVKRIIATEGDTVAIKKGHVYVNDQMITENYLKEESTLGDLEIFVEEDSYFVLGDNRSVSLDSREGSIGLVKENEILGEVIIKMFPFEKIGDESYEY